MLIGGTYTVVLHAMEYNPRILDKTEVNFKLRIIYIYIMNLVLKTQRKKRIFHESVRVLKFSIKIHIEFLGFLNAIDIIFYL